MEVKEQQDLRALDFAVGEKVMGWFRRKGMMHGVAQDVLTDRNGSTYSVTCGCLEDFNPSTDIDAAMRVEDRIAELGLRRGYYARLVQVVSQSITDRVFDSFDVVHASAEQRCRAALAAIAEKEDHD